MIEVVLLVDVLEVVRVAAMLLELGVSLREDIAAFELICDMFE